MMRLLDSDVLIDVMRGFAPARQWLATLPEIPRVPSIACMELIAGCHNKSDLQRVQKLINLYTLAWLTESDSQRALTYFVQLHLSHNQGLTDALIAATAVGRGATLCTFNVKHFSVVPGLIIEQPYSRP